MSLKLLDDKRGGFLLCRGGEQIGWIDGGRVAFLGFDSADEARRAADTAFDTLRVWVARQRRTDAAPGPGTALGTWVDGGPHTKLTLDGIAVGRIIEPDDDLPYRSTYGFEIRLPRGLGPSAGAGAARIIDAALGRWSAVRDLEQLRTRTSAAPDADRSRIDPRRRPYRRMGCESCH